MTIARRLVKPFIFSAAVAAGVLIHGQVSSRVHAQDPCADCQPHRNNIATLNGDYVVCIQSDDNNQFSGGQQDAFSSGNHLDALWGQCCGIDVHKESLVACLRQQEGRRKHSEVQSFGTTTAEILRLHVVIRGGMHACRDGIDRRVLAAGLQSARGQFRRRASECASDQSRSGSQDGRQGLRVAGRPARARVDPRELHSARADSKKQPNPWKNHSAPHNLCRRHRGLEIAGARRTLSVPSLPPSCRLLSSPRR
jgi:hypothetical protein